MGYVAQSAFFFWNTSSSSYYDIVLHHKFIYSFGLMHVKSWGNLASTCKEGICSQHIADLALPTGELNRQLRASVNQVECSGNFPCSKGSR